MSQMLGSITIVAAHGQDRGREDGRRDDTSTLGVELTVYTQAATVTSSLTLIPQPSTRSVHRFTLTREKGIIGRTKFQSPSPLSG